MTPDEKGKYDQALNFWKSIPMGLGYKTSMDLQKRARPSYVRNKAYDENLALARTNLNAPDREAQIARTDIDESAVDAIARAREFSGSTSSLLDTLASLNTGRTKALRGLAADQTAIRQQKLATMMGANIASAEEDDKAWNYNVNQPYQARVKETVDYEKWRKENEANQLDFLGSLLTSALPFIGKIGKGGQQSNVRTSYDVAGDNGY